MKFNSFMFFSLPNNSDNCIILRIKNQSIIKIIKKQISAPKSLNEAYSYAKPATFSRGTKISYGPFNLVVISGTASVNEKGESIHKNNLKAQTERTFANLKALLEESELEWKDVIKTNIYLRDIDRDYEDFCKTRKKFYDSLELPFYPAATCVEAKICRSDLLVEIELWALNKN